jgi:HAE1 family hydrophobic/amphiphilic exporter-1
MMALTLAVGFVVDDAIVMLENIHRHVEMGKPVMEAALEGSKEIGFTILSMTVSLVAVFIPILFLGGLLGRLFHEFAVVIGASILVSGFVSLTLTPMLCSRFLKPHHAETHGRFYNASEAIYQKVFGWYEGTLHWAMRHRGTTMAFSAGVLAGTVALFALVSKGFIPNTDQGAVYGTVEAVQGIGFDAMVSRLDEVATVVKKDPAVDAVMTSSGGGGPFGGSGNEGRVSVYFKPRNERAGVDQILRRVNGKLTQVPGVRVFISNPPAIRIGGRSTKSPYQFTLQTPDIDALYQYAGVLEEKMRDLPDLTDVTTDLQLRNPQLKIDIDRDRAASLALGMDQVQNALYNAYGSRQISTIFGANNDHPVMLELLPEFQRDPAAINLLHVRSRTGALVPLGSVARVSPTMGPNSVNHSGQLPSVTLSFNIREGASLGAAVSQVQRLADRTLPATISTAFSGTAQAFQQSQSGLFFLLLVAIAVIYLVLGVLYESFIHPLTILSGLPFAVFGALLTLLVFSTDLNIYSYVGLILLVGLVKKNAIMMIDFALDAQRGGKSAADAAVEACLVRFRPIMMTTMCALMGTLPIAVGFGAGASARRPLGIAVVGGLAFSQMVTLFVTPVIYTYLDGFQRWAENRFRKRAPARAAQPAYGAAAD